MSILIYVFLCSSFKNNRPAPLPTEQDGNHTASVCYNNQMTTILYHTRPKKSTLAEKSPLIFPSEFAVLKSQRRIPVQRKIKPFLGRDFCTRFYLSCMFSFDLHVVVVVRNAITILKNAKNRINTEFSAFMRYFCTKRMTGLEPATSTLGRWRSTG